MTEIRLPAALSGNANMWAIVLGPPGCGKTTSLLQLFEGELKSGTPPGRIAFVSFTRAARREVVERVGRQFNLGLADLPWLRTIHSTAYRLLRVGRGRLMTRYAWKEFAGKYAYKLTDPRLADENLDEGPAEPPRRTKDDFLRFVHEWGRNRMLDMEKTLARFPQHVPAPAFRDFVARLGAFKAQKNLLDFSDLLDHVLKGGLRPDVDVAFVDEAQDLSPLQIAVVEQWFRPCRRVYVGGDEDQAIYAFQGAEPDWLLGLARKNVTIILDQSYRVPARVHALAQKIIGRNKNRINKVYRPFPEAGVVESLALNEAMDLLDGETDAFVLARNRMFLKPVADALLARRVPYLVEGSGGTSPMSSAATVAAVRAAHLISKGVDLDADDLRTLLAMIPSRGVGLLPHGVKARTKELDGVVTRKSMIQLGLARMIEEIQQKGPTSVLLKVSPDSRDYFQALLDRYGEIPDPRIRLTSIHGAKGREADLVVLLGDMTQATYAEYQDGRHGGTEAENRVAYVGVTRARKRLVIVFPTTRRFYEFPAIEPAQAACARGAEPAISEASCE